MDPGFRCSENPPQIYFARVDGFCESFIYRGCGGNLNRFRSATDCDTFCINQGSAAPMASSSTAFDFRNSDEYSE